MSYEKRVCVLRQLRKGFSADGSALSGVVYAERLGGEVTFTPRIVGLSPLKEGRYALVVRIGGDIRCFSLDGQLTCSAGPLKDGFSVLLCFVRGEAEPLAFGNCGREGADYGPLLSALTEDGKKKPATPLPPVQTPAPLAPNVPYAPGVPLPGGEEREVSYDDDAIASTDYFADEAHADADREGENGAKMQKTAGEGDSLPHADGLGRPRGSLTYYKEVREELGKVMERYPADTRLKWAFPQSEWARSEKALIGIVYEEGIPRYLCVATEEQDDETKEQSVFVPMSPFTDEKGFWVVFQDADTGAYVKVETT